MTLWSGDGYVIVMSTSVGESLSKIDVNVIVVVDIISWALVFLYLQEALYTAARNGVFFYAFGLDTQNLSGRFAAVLCVE